MPKSLYKKLIANSEKEVLKHSKFLKVSLKAIAKAVAQELKAQVKEIGPISHLADQRIVIVRVETRNEISAEQFKVLTDNLHKYDSFCTLTLNLETGKGFSVAHYVDQPFAYIRK